MTIALSSFRHRAVGAIAGFFFVLALSVDGFAQQITCPITGDTTLSGTADNPAPTSCVVNTGVTLTIAGSGTLTNNSGAFVVINGALTNDGVFLNSEQATLTNFGTVLNNFSFQGTPAVFGGDTVTNAGGATLTNFGQFSTANFNNAGTVANAGAITILSPLNNCVQGCVGTLTNFTNATFDNTGTLSAGLQTSITNNATLTNFVGGLISSNGTLTNNSTLVNNGTLTIGSVSLPGAIEHGLLANNGTLTNNNLLSADGGDIQNNGLLTNFGTVTLADNTTNSVAIFRNNSGATFSNASGGSLVIGGNGSTLNGWLINNSGSTLINQAGASITLTAAGALSDFGTVTNSGALTNNGAEVSIGNGAVLTNQAGSSYIQTSGLTFVIGTLNTVPAVQIQGGTLLGSGGTINGDLDNSGGTVVPSSLLINGNYTQGSGATLEIDLGTTGNGLLKVSGAATLEPGADLNIFLSAGFMPFLGEMFTIMDFSSGSGVFANAPTTGFVMDGFNWTIAYNANNIVLDAGSPTPEPSSLLLLGSGLLGLVALRRRTHRA